MQDRGRGKPCRLHVWVESREREVHSGGMLRSGARRCRGVSSSGCDEPPDARFNTVLMNFERICTVPWDMLALFRSREMVLSSMTLRRV